MTGTDSATTQASARDTKRNIENAYPLSPMQQGMLFHSLYAPASGIYVEQLVATLAGDLHVDAFKRAWQQVTDRHSILRTAFAWKRQEKPVQAVYKELALPVEVVDWREFDPEEQERLLQERLAAERVRGFDLSKAPLMRLLLIRSGATEHRLVWSHHHILLDGWSLPIILREVFALYEAEVAGRTVHLQPARPYRDYISWLNVQDMQAAETYWRRALAGWKEPTRLRLSGPPSPGQGSDEVEVRLNAEETAQLNAFARQKGLTLSTTIQGAWAVVLGRYSGDDEVVFGVTVSGRPAGLPGADTMVGLFINTLPVRVRLDTDAPAGEWLLALQDQVAEMRQFEYTPLVQVQGWSEVPRDQPLFDTIMVFENYPVDATLREQLGSLQIRGVRSFEQTNYGLTVVSGPGRELALKISYNRSQFDEPTVLRALGHLKQILTGLPSHADAPVASIPMLTRAELDQLSAWNDTAAPLVAEPLHALFERWVEQTPDAPAVEFAVPGEDTPRARYTYDELNRRANQLAHALIRAGVGPEVLVGISLERSLDMIVALLAVLKAGGAYLPLDLAYPPDRLRYMLEDSGVRLVLTQADLLSERPWLRPASGEAFCLDADRAKLAGLPETNPDAPVGPDNLAYVIYTSGSTGRPKGVLLHHRGLSNFALALALGPDATQRVRVLQFATFSFDASVLETAMALAWGGTLVMTRQEHLTSGPELLALLRDARITAALLPPSLLAVLEPVDLPDFETIVAGGERCPSEVAQKWAPGRRFFNAYGPTETTVCATMRICHPDETWPSGGPPIGSPIRNFQCYVVNSRLQLQPVEAPGELLIGGVGVARGYLNRPELTAERFVTLPPASAGADAAATYGGRLYRTGDLVRRLPDGELEFLGRIDDQIKLRGFRIELGEIEAALRELPRVQDVAVVVRNDRQDDQRLVAFLVLDQPEDSAAQTPVDWRAALRRRLPEYMIPSAFASLDALPLTPAGKIDRRALASAPLSLGSPERAPGSVADTALRTADEELLAGIFSRLLGVDGVRASDSFFDLGGHSLLAMRLASRIREVFGVELALRDLFESPTVAGIAAKVAAARSDEASLPAPSIAPVPRPHNPADGLPLSFAQQRLWFLDQLEPGNLFYNIPTVLRLRGQLDVPALTGALNEIIRRHEVLRTTFAANAGVPRQIIAPALTLDVPVTDLRSEPPDLREPHAIELAREEIRRPFDLAAGPLLRARLLQLDDGEFIAVLVIHHIVADGWSMGVFVAELANLYDVRITGDANASPLQPLAVQYADFAAWQRAWLEGTSGRRSGDSASPSDSPLERQLEYWKKQLTGAPARLDLPTDRPRPAVQSSNGRTHSFRFTPDLSQGLARLSQSQGVTLFMTLLAGYQALLSRYSGQDDIVVGSALANRQRAEVEPLIGFFVNTLVFRTRFDAGPAGPLTFKELLARVRETSLGAYAHQDVPFEMLVDTLLREGIQPERSLSHSPLFQAALSLQNVPVPVRELPGLTLEPVNLDKGIAGFDMLLQVTETPDGLACAWEYNSDLFDAATIERMTGHLQTLFAAAVADPARPVATLPLLTETERHTMLVSWNNTATAWDLERTFHSRFEEHAARIPGALAAVFALPGSGAVQSLTYAELDRRANQVARHLLALGVQKGSLVAISTERSLEMTTGILGILKSGAAYLPLDPTYPPDRLAFMLADSGVVALLTQSHLVERLPLADFAAPVVRLDSGSDAGDWPIIAPHPDTSPAAGLATPDSLAYCIYTSGSTGRPKGVLVRHRGMINLAEVHRREFDMREGKRVLQFSPFSFDASVWETVMALGNGATLVLTRQETLASGPELLRLMREQRITTVTLPPSLLAILGPSAADTALPDLETVIAAGERCVDEIVRAWAPGRRFFNAYGPTETTVCATMGLCDPSIDWPFGGPPIGKALANFQLYVANDAAGAGLQPQPVGVPGELLVAGPSLAQGYLNRPDLTAERFIRNPFAARPGLLPVSDRVYRTGDLVRWLPDGNLEFLGRIDDQVKVRGFRIELGEIESVLREHPSVRDAVVAARDNALIGYYIPADPAPEARERAPQLTSSLRAHLRARLPEYMVPAALIALDAFPITPAGKIDRRALPAPDQARRDAAAEYVAPRTGTETRLAAMAAQLLNLERVGVEDNFFELGGHSLLATQLISRIRDEFKVETALKALFEHPTVAGLAVAVDEGLQKQAAEQAKVADALAMVKGMSPEQVRALLAAKKAQAAAQAQDDKGTGP